MSQPLQPGWCDQAKKAGGTEEPKRCFRVRQADVEASRKRGSAKGARSRFALRNLPPVDDELPPLPEDDE
jgi:hypothetical protein